MGLFDNIRQDVLDEFEGYAGSAKRTVEVWYESNKSFGVTDDTASRKEWLSKSIELIDLLEFKRWGYYPICPSCGCDKCYTLFSRERTYKCSEIDCHIKFNVFRNTILSVTRISINIWFDAVQELRNNENINVTDFSKKNGITQKTGWMMFEKIKSSPYAMEADVPIPHVLLSPKKFTYSTRKSKKLSFDERTKNNINNLRLIYGENTEVIESISSLNLLLKNYYESNQRLLGKDIGINKNVLSRLLSGKTKISDNTKTKIDLFVYNHTMKTFGDALGNKE